MASCQCNNTCSRSGKRGACPCKQKNRFCNYFCRCGHLLPCSNLEESTIGDDICFGSMKQHEDINTHRKRLHHVDVPQVPTKVRKQMTKPRPSKIPIRKKSGTATPGSVSLQSLQPTISSISPPPSSVRGSTKPTSVKSKSTSTRLKSKTAKVRSASATTTPAATSTPSPSWSSAVPLPPPNQEPTTEGLLKINSYIDHLDETTRRELLAKLIWQDNQVYKKVLETSHEPGDQPPEEPSPSSWPSWCRCGNCRPMPTDIENRCCTKKRGQCVTHTDKFNRVVMDEDVLDAAGAYRNDLYAYDHHRNNRMFRHTAYRQFILMKHGVLRSGERKVVPSCTVLKIRECYPADNGHYTGFRPGRL